MRVTEDAFAVKEQHELLDPICSLVFEEQASRRRLVENRPELLLALQHLSPGDRLTVVSARELGPSYVDGWAVMVQLAELGVPLRVLSGTDAGDYNHPSELRELIREISELKRESVSRRIKRGLELARRDGARVGRPSVIDDDVRTSIMDKRRRGSTLRSIAQSVGVSVGTVHKVLETEWGPGPRRRT